MRRQMIAKLDRLAQEMGPAEDGSMPTGLDFVCEYIAAGADEDGSLRTFASLARLHGFSADLLSSWINSTAESKAKIASARLAAAHVLAEQSVEVLDDLAGTEVTREEVALANARADKRQWLASKWNRGQYGADAAVQIHNTNFSLPEQHLAALVARKQVKAKVETQALPAGPDYEVVSGD